MSKETVSRKDGGREERRGIIVLPDSDLEKLVRGVCPHYYTASVIVCRKRDGGEGKGSLFGAQSRLSSSYAVFDESPAQGEGKGHGQRCRRLFVYAGWI